MLEGCTPWPEEFVKRYVEAGYWAGQTLGDMLDESAERFGPREAVVGDGGTRYTYGDLKANPRDLLIRYFDASLSFAHWFYVELAFRFPKTAVDMRGLRRYAAGQSLDRLRRPPRRAGSQSSDRPDGTERDAGD